MFKEILFNLGEVLDVFVPSEEIIVLNLLFVGHLEQIVIKLSEHVEICESYVSAYKESSLFEMFLEILTSIKTTFRSSLPSLR